MNKNGFKILMLQHFILHHYENECYAQKMHKRDKLNNFPETWKINGGVHKNRNAQNKVYVALLKKLIESNAIDES